jgi:hypothetical protein
LHIFKLYIEFKNFEVWEEEDWDKYLGHFGKLASKTEKMAMKLPDQIVAVSNPTGFK